MATKLKITIKAERVRTFEPPIVIYNVALEDERGTWEETFGSRERLEAFLTGVRAALTTVNQTFIEIPEIPRPD